MITIKTAELQDLSAILAIEQLVFNTGSYPAFVIRQLFDIATDLFIVAKENNKILGFVIGTINTNKKQGWILSIAVHPAARGKQIGKQLTSKIITLLKEKSCSEICLTVHPENTVAIKIYKALGFIGNVIIDNYFLDNEKRIVMTLKTKQP